MNSDGYIKNFQELNVSTIPPLDTAIYASGDVLFIPIQVNVLDSVAINKKLRFRVRGVTAIDMGGQNAAFDLLFFNASATPASFGARNAACALNAADAAAGLRALVQCATYVTVVSPVGVSRPVVDPFVITLPAGQKYVWLAGIARATPTYPAATNLKIILGLEILNDTHA